MLLNHLRTEGSEEVELTWNILNQGILCCHQGFREYIDERMFIKGKVTYMDEGGKTHPKERTPFFVQIESEHQTGGPGFHKQKKKLETAHGDLEDIYIDTYTFGMKTTMRVGNKKIARLLYTFQSTDETLLVEG